MLRAFKVIFVAGLCTVTSGCMVAPIASLALKPIVSAVTATPDGGDARTKGPITVDQLLANARGDKPERPDTPEAKAIAAAMAADPKPSDQGAAGAISVAALLQQARTDTPEMANGAAAPKSNRQRIEVRLSDVLANSSAFIQMQMTINGWDRGTESLHVSLGAGQGTSTAAAMSLSMKQLRQLCQRLSERCHAEAAIIQPGLETGWVRLSPGKGVGRA